MPSRRPGRGRAARALAAALALALPVGVASEAPESWRFELPPGFPAPFVPDDNPMSAVKVELGRRLFSDRRLSITGDYACVSCHDPARAFTDGRARAVGATGELHPRSAMSLVNVAYHASFGWADPATRSLEAQAAIPMFARHPLELGLAGREAQVMDELLAGADDRAAFEAAFPEAGGRFDLSHVRMALAAYQRTLLSARSPYDRYVFRDERDALDASARRGMQLFFSERLACASCHPAPLFASPARYAGVSPEPRLHDNGLGPFRVPTLRNVALTAPYMHDGRFRTLREVVLHYSGGGPESPAFELDEAGIEDLVAFLESLTDEEPAYAVGPTP